MELKWEDRCSICHHASREAVLTPLSEYKLCQVCENRIRNGLIHYRPSNGSEFDMFYNRCEKCRHYIDNLNDPQPGSLVPPYTACTWGILDRLHVSMAYGYEHISNWFDPSDIAPTCPATCKRFTHKNDSDGESRDPPRPVDPAQLTFDDLDIPVETIASPAPVREGR